MVWCKAYFDIVNRLGVDNDCDGHSEGQADGLRGRHYGSKCCA